MFGGYMNVVINNKKIEVHDCTSFQSRFMGLMFTRNFNYGLRFGKCNSIHTFFMLEDIDVVMTDKDDNVLHIFKCIKPFRVILPKKGVYNTYEFPGGTVTSDIRMIKIKDRI